MARAAYDLQTIREGTVISSNGTDYTINILFTSTGGADSMEFDSSGVKIEYETPSQQDKNSYILTSKCTIPFLVQNASDQNFIRSLSTDYNERDVWITVREGSEMLWCGYVILDLKDEQDVSYPYEVSLTAVDGLASLKDILYVREINATTGLVPKFPYIDSDTFINEGFTNLLANTVTSGTLLKFIPDLLYKTGQLLSNDDTGGTTFLTNYVIETSVNYYNEGHPAPATDIDPLAYTKIKINRLHKTLENDYVTPPNAYDVLEYICKNFGMRCIYWQHRFHFIQINEYNTNEDAAGTISDPINIPSRVYYHTGFPRAGVAYTKNHVGNNNLSIYNIELENDITTSGLQKLSGTIYSGLPAIKKVESVYLSYESENAWRYFPLMDTSGFGAAVTNKVTEGGSSVLSDVASATGLNLRFSLSYKNTTNTTISIMNMFMLMAREVGQTSFFPVKVCARNTATTDYSWQDWTSGTLPFNGTSAVSRWTFQGNNVAQNAVINQSIGQTAYQSSSDPYCLSNGGSFPVDAAFTGDWTFQIITWTHWRGSGSSVPMLNNGTSYGSTYNHGAVYTAAGSNPLNFDGTAFATYQAIEDYKYDYLNTLNPISGTNNAADGSLKAVSTLGNIKEEIVIDVETNNSYVLDMGYYFWGDGQSIRVTNDGLNYVAAGYSNWTKPTYAWNSGTSQFDYTVGLYDKKLVVLNLLDVIYNQSIALKQFNGTTALSEIDKYYTGTTVLKYFNPIARMQDSDGKKYLFMSGGFNLSMDEWSVISDEINYEVPTETITIGGREFEAEITIE
tara:strand:- start:1207 stop:3582 length:2376 start_codon:yes stop_codon:yes gene_type:complete